MLIGLIGTARPPDAVSGAATLQPPTMVLGIFIARVTALPRVQCLLAAIGGG